MKFVNTIRARRVPKIVAHLGATQEHVEEAGRKVEARAQANLAAHRKTGEHHIEYSKGFVDRSISLVGPGALSLELGHHNKWSGEWVEGTGILRNALKGG